MLSTGDATTLSRQQAAAPLSVAATGNASQFRGCLCPRSGVTASYFFELLKKGGRSSAGPMLLLLLLQALLVASMRVERMRGPHATSTTRRALLANAETTTRRAAFATAAATLATTRRCDALQLEGEYADPNHVDGWRKIKVTGDRARITGQDDPGGPVWSIKGLATDSTIALLVEPGSVQPPAGTTMESVDDVIVPVFRGDIVADGIKWPDGNKWQRR